MSALILPYRESGEANPFFAPLRELPSRISEADQTALRQQALEAIRGAVVPAYVRLLGFMRDVYLPGAREDLAARSLPDGEAFYRAQIREYTTLDLTPEDIHEQGRKEVARIWAEMKAVRDEVEFDGDMAAFFEFLRSDPQFYAKHRQSCLAFRPMSPSAWMASCRKRSAFCLGGASRCCRFPTPSPLFTRVVAAVWMPA